MIMKCKRTKSLNASIKKTCTTLGTYFPENVLVICLSCSRELPLPCCGLRCSCDFVQAATFCAVDQNASIVMVLILSSQINFSHTGFSEDLIL